MPEPATVMEEAPPPPVRSLGASPMVKTLVLALPLERVTAAPELTVVVPLERVFGVVVCRPSRVEPLFSVIARSSVTALAISSVVALLTTTALAAVPRAEALATRSVPPSIAHPPA